ncbi:MAG: glycosyltransferase family 4 protein [Actinomycetota bacterium]|nr:glycosyltransferase family 4 protein [Actinomycetota bacterium]
MNILHISESDAAGGAGRAAYKLHSGLNGLGHSSRMLVGRKVTADPAVRRLKRNVAWRTLDRGSGELLDRLGLQYVFYPSSLGVLTDGWFRNADVVQLHNLHGSYFGFTALPRLSSRRPVVWQLHDQWGLTGHVAYSLDCERWRHGCGSCPYLGEYPRLSRDTTALLWRLKDAVYSRSRLSLVVPSRWMAKLVRESPLLCRFPTHHIPTGIDTDAFRPGPQEEARRRFGLPLDRRIVFFAAADLNERRKGLHLLIAALRRMNDPPLLVLAGSGVVSGDVEHRALGTLSNEDVLADAYRAADLFAVPTLADVLTQTAPESIACSTPCVSFDRGGVTDVVRHLETGYEARFGDVDDLARGIATLLGDPALLERLRRRCREVAEEEFTVTRQVRLYAELYEELVAGAPAAR